MLELESKPSEGLAQWLNAMWVDYRASMIEAGIGPEQADENIRGHQQRLFVDGVAVESQRFYDIVDAGRSVGTVWISGPQASDPGTWFIYDIVIDEDQRGKGYGRRAMQSCETLVRDEGGTRLALNVFGPNAVARHLYESLGFVEIAISMFKNV